jgi:hypothetical protein
MQRLIAFGASNTYGQGLEDCHVPPCDPGPSPSKFAWPSILSQQMGLECKNMSDPGASNAHIIEELLKFKFEPDDIIVVMWTDPYRDILHKNEKETITLAHWQQDPSINIKEWVLLHNDYDMSLRSWKTIHHAYVYLKLLGNQFYMLTDNKGTEFISTKPAWASEIEFPNIYMSDIRKTYPVALDGRHPGFEAHAMLANLIYQNIYDHEN